MESFKLEDVYAILGKVTDVICENAMFLCELDSVVGDGDHGTTIRRGVKAAQEKIETEKPDKVDKLLAAYALGMVSTMGGASGPIFSSMFLGMGMASQGSEEVTLSHLVEAFENGLARVKKIGRSDEGDKTLIDALAPGIRALKASSEAGESLGVALNKMHEAALEGIEVTKTLVANKGRSRYAGERGLGHQDAGATSVTLIIKCFAEQANQG
ncbi:MAG: dihydroxyacetone kinase subunit DhaL [Lentisphaeraceae bacterium]|nr:dihydroxyacetone kinase subunit DhaL [Lentisphaeraceae bacterium]